ncbi:AMP-binding protein [Pseudomonas sp. Irchel s3h17]|uniref:AMP-binding protein n=1 Tax=Pseudomonas sp. Irchel s3h17 TaxID=2009182 RepID=UPI000BA423AF|nr:AMP-binding protein [Pseudomonas sp. Irchel s3h17]
MTIKSRTSFDIDKFNKMVGEYAEQAYPLDLPPVTGYDDFVQKYPPLSKQTLMEVSDVLIDAGQLMHCYVISTSGTTSAPLVLASRIFQRVTEDSYPYQVRGFMAEHVFCADDTVVNLLTAGCLGYNYEGMCRMLEPIGSTVLPVGRPDVMNNMPSLLGTMKRFKANVLVGSPTGIIQVAQAAERLDVDLAVTKIVFVGEAFHLGKREFIQRLWPKARFYSLYGATELGFAALNTPAMEAHQHLILSDWFFMEQTEAGELLVTDLKAPVVPIIRYRIGDVGELNQGEDNQYYLTIGQRVAEEFSLGGHRICLTLIEQVLVAADVPAEAFQVQLSTTDAGKDCVTVLVDLDPSVIDASWTARLEEQLFHIPKLKEAVMRGVAVVKWAGNVDFAYNPRGKFNRLLDQRNQLSVVS